MTALPPDFAQTDIAIVGMAAHLPGAADIGAYWENLRQGLRSIRRLSEDELIAAGEDPALIRNPNYVPFAAPLDNFADFDAEFFGFSPKEAAILDPQHRQFLEVAWHALENAGQMPGDFAGTIGVYAGCGMGSYFYFNICSNRDLVRDVGMFLLRHTGNDKDFLSTRVSHVFDLRGPSINVQTACSTSLVALHYAAQALLSGECDMALAGGVTIELPQMRGYLYKENEILSPDGECHAFDHRAQGTVFGSGAGCVVLKRLSDAIRDGDHIWAVVKGSAVNNDGAQKAGYLAPSVEGQARCIAEAQAIADVTADTVDYVECHGTGTYLGDPIEVSALTEAFRQTTDATGFCRIGSVKTNIGHLDTAAGVASLIKVALSLHHRQIPPSLGFEAPNPTIDFETSPFAVNAVLTDWMRRDHPRRAGVNSLGVGGTNAHAVLQEAPVRAPSEPSDWPFQLLCLSARSKAALDGTAKALAGHLDDTPHDLADIAWTLHAGRQAFDKRRVVVAETPAEAADLLRADDPRRVFTHTALDRPDTVFMFPGGGAQYAGMARDLYETEPVFAEWMDRGLAVLQPRLDYDIRALWLPEHGEQAAASERLKRPSVQLPLIMITEYALAQMLIAWGVQPSALVGHSMGENTAACLAGVISFEECIGLVHLRGQLFDTVAPGGMLSVPLSVAALTPYLGDLDIASVNAPELTVVSGPDADLADLAQRLAADGVETQRIAIDIAAHSQMLEPILDAFHDHLTRIPLSPPRIPVVSNRTGQPLSDAQATSPEYWTQHLRGSVLFADCVATLAEKPNRIWIEVGPGRALSSLVKMGGAVPAQQVLAALRHPDEQIADDVYHIGLLGRIWALGGEFDWDQIWGDARRVKVPLPGYAFDRREYFIAPAAPQADTVTALPARIQDVAEMGTRIGWVPRSADLEIDPDTELADAPVETWLAFSDAEGIATPVLERLRDAGHKVIEVRLGDVFRLRGGVYTLPAERGREGYDQLVQDLVHRGLLPTRIAHFWLAGSTERFRPGSNPFQAHLEQGFYALTFLAQALMAEGITSPIHTSVITAGAASLRDEALRWPEKAMIAGPARVWPHEAKGITVATLDLPLSPVRRRGAPASEHTGAILAELLARPANTIAAIRDGRRWEQVLRPEPLSDTPPLPQGGVWAITGGFGGIGQSVAEALIRESGARIALIGRTPLPPRADWPACKADLSNPAARRILQVEQLESLGAVVLPLAADVCNIDEMRAALDQVRAELGPIHGVVHAAGAIDDAPLLGKSLASIEGVLAPKVHGLRVLDALLPDGAVDRIVLFSSTSTLTAPAGQVDYVAANEYLNAFAKARRGETRVTAIDWGIWQGVGMAADAMAARLGQAPALPRMPVDVPLLDTAGHDAGMNRQFEARYSQDMWLLDEHRTRDGRALVPGTGILEIALQALKAQDETEPFQINDLTFLRALDVDTPRDIRVTLARSAEGYDFALRSAVRLRGRDGFALNAQARVVMGAIPEPAPLDLNAITERCILNVAEDPTGLRTEQEEHLAFGPRWRVLNRRAYGQGEGIAHLSLPPAAQGDSGYILHPALMDIATGWAMALIPGYRGQSLWVPVSYGQIRVWHALPERIVSHVRIAPSEPGFASFDITLATPDGQVCAQVERFVIKELAQGLGTPAPLLPSEVVFDESPADRALTPGEERLARNLAQGLTPSEGSRAFLAALASDQPQVIVSSLTLPELIAEAAQPLDTGPTDGQKFERPNLDSAFVAPRNDVERMMVGMWEDLLGVSGVGVQDSFFDLGGHSLIAVRLFARVKKTWAVDFPISILFQAPTVEKIAAQVAERAGILDADATPDTAPAVPTRRFEFLVPMHDGEGGPRTPFFLVAGMFGNVLNLRHLAQLLGNDRPFYGLQARGLLGDAEPHRRLDEAARDYLAEVRQIQPHGPYLIGGFSGGGLTALEMAHQLRAAGEEVRLLTLLDTPLPQRPGLTRPDKAMIKLHEFRRKGPGYLREWMENRRAWQQELARMAQEAEGETDSGFHNRAIEAAFRDSLPHVELRRYDGPVALFRPPLDRHWKVTGGRWVSAAKEYVHDDNDWGRFMPHLIVHEVPGDHDSMVLEPNVRVMAAKLRALIAEGGA